MTGSSALADRRLLFVVNWATMGGAERFALEAASFLRDAHGADVALCALTSAEGRAREEVSSIGFPWVELPLAWGGGGGRKLETMARIVSGVRALRPDVLLPVCTVPNVLCALTWGWTGARACVWNQRDVALSSRFRPATIRAAARRPTLLAACAVHVRDFLETEYEAPPARIRVVRPGVEIKAPRVGRQEWRARLSLEGRDVAVCMLAHLHRFKDHETLLRAWHLVHGLRRNEARAVLLLAGREAGTEAILKALAYDLDLRDSVRFLGDVEDVSGLASACDVGVLSSRAEGIGRSVLELMSSGQVVAGTDIAGIREALGPGGEEWLAPPGNAEGLAAVLARLLDDAGLRRRLGDANRERVRTVFSPEAARARYAIVVREALERSGARCPAVRRRPTAVLAGVRGGRAGARP